jgi:hypothetical protein
LASSKVIGIKPTLPQRLRYASIAFAFKGAINAPKWFIEDLRCFLPIQQREIKGKKI